MLGHWLVIGVGCLVTPKMAVGAEPTSRPAHLRVALVQLALADSIVANRDRVVERIEEAAAMGARVVVFPEGTVRGAGGDDPAVVEAAVEAIRRGANQANVYVVFGAKSRLASANKDTNWMYAIGPDGRDLLRYEKLYDNHHAAMPGVFYIDGVPCSAMICADRWLRGVEEVPIQQGAQVTFELSNNYGCEWVPEFEWYWNVSRAMRNNVWVLFSNSCNHDLLVSRPPQSCHGHSAVIAPDGRIMAASRDNKETIVFADLDLSQATRAAGQARFTHPAMRHFWEAGAQLQRGENVDAPAVKQLASPDVTITLAVAQVSGDLSRMKAMIQEARSRNADLVVFPARAIDERAIDSLQAAAREHRLAVVVGSEHRADDGRRNSAFVIGPDGELLTRYDQLSATEPFQPGLRPRTMWFRVKGLPAVVTIEQDGLWTELAELAAVAGARIHVHLDHDADASPEAALRHRQVWANLMSFHTFGAAANVTGSTIWEDLRDREERQAALAREGHYGDKARADAAGKAVQAKTVAVCSPFSANLVVQAGALPQLLVATRHVSGKNNHFPARTSQFNPQMDAWYRIGAAIVNPPWEP